MFIFALFCLLAVGSQAKPVVEPAQHIVIVTPQAQVHLEPALRYVHGLSQLARVSGPHHEETIVYVPAGAAAAVVPNVVNEAVVAGRQIENIPATAQQIQQQAQQGVEIVSGQFGEAAAAAAATGAGFFPGFFPSSNQKQEEQQLKLETPANTQPLPVATEARHFYSLPQVYHTPVVDVVHTPVYSWPISTIRARSIQADEAALPAIELKAEAAAAPEQPLAAAAIPAIAIEPAQPLLKEQKQEQAIEQQPLEPAAQAIIPFAAALPEASEAKAEIAARQLEETANAIKPEQPLAPQAKDGIKQPLAPQAKDGIKQPLAPQAKDGIKQPLTEAIKEEPKQQQQQELEKPAEDLKIKAIPVAPVAIAEPEPQAAQPQPEALPAAIAAESAAIVPEIK